MERFSTAPTAMSRLPNGAQVTWAESYRDASVKRGDG